MNDLINVSYENERPTVMGRELHEVLGMTSSVAAERSVTAQLKNAEISKS